MNTKATPDVTIEDVYVLASIVRRHRAWHRREQFRYPLHPLISEALKLARPVNWHQLLLEWPHRSTGDHSMIAYTRDDAKGEADSQVRVGAGKYLARHWPHLSSSTVRDLVAAHITKMDGSCEFLPATTEEIVRSVQEGPRSCMRWDEDDLDEGCTDGHHPYEVYSPELGWKAAVRFHNGRIAGRALVHDGTHMRGKDRHQAVFVRSYKAYQDNPDSTEYSHADEKLEVWLCKQGVRKVSSWPVGTPFAHVRSSRGPVLPYLDGDDTQVTCAVDGVHYSMPDNDEEGYNCCNTDGTADDVDGDRCSCAMCGDRTDSEDSYYVDDQDICSRCLDRHYTSIDGEWVPDDRVAQTQCGETRWDSRGEMPDNVRVLDWGRYAGDYVDENDVVCDIDGDYWHVDDIDEDEGIVRLCDDSKHADEYVLRTDAIAVGDDWYHKDDTEQTSSRPPRGAPTIVKATHGEYRGDYIRADEAVTCVYGTGAGVWHENDLWETACAGEHEGPMAGMAPGVHFVRLHDDSRSTDEAVDVTEALWVKDEGWFIPLDLEDGTIVRIMDDVFALATDLIPA